MECNIINLRDSIAQELINNDITIDEKDIRQ